MQLGCTGKVAHRTFNDAINHIRKPYKSGTRDKLRHQKLDVYKCPYCSTWHVGKTINTTHVKRRGTPYRCKSSKIDA